MAVLKKIIKIRDNLKPVKKAGKVEYNGQFRYSYQSVEDIISMVRPLLIKEGVTIYIDNSKVTDYKESPSKSGVNRFIQIRVKFAISDGEDTIYSTIVGEGMDSGDKAIYKAITGATKYLYKELFQVEAGEDDYDRTPSPRYSRPATQQRYSGPDGIAPLRSTTSTEPASAKQLDYIAKLSGFTLESLKKKKLTKAKASELINNLSKK